MTENTLVLTPKPQWPTIIGGGGMIALNAAPMMGALAMAAQQPGGIGAVKFLLGALGVGFALGEGVHQVARLYRNLDYRADYWAVVGGVVTSAVAGVGLAQIIS